MELTARKMHLSSSTSRNESQLVVVLLTLVALLALDLAGTEARYLPTRADESDLAVLKDLIRMVLLEQSSLVGAEASNNRPVYYNQQPFQVQRRAMEIPHLSSGDNSIRSVETRAGAHESAMGIKSLLD